eukprot:TRINITY_DN11308_c0_g1_i4.p2 TRINITY_DN11308_c0_g1~~TRINITY_DN11308_c0_g1_i4.p2  ORF type:complete len:227 (+),score=-13.45 TRINITY_DN11308_c0_g1_i4:487-1167(+)
MYVCMCIYTCKDIRNIRFTIFVLILTGLTESIERNQYSFFSAFTPLHLCGKVSFFWYIAKPIYINFLQHFFSFFNLRLYYYEYQYVLRLFLLVLLLLISRYVYRNILLLVLSQVCTSQRLSIQFNTFYSTTDGFNNMFVEFLTISLRNDLNSEFAINNKVYDPYQVLLIMRILCTNSLKHPSQDLAFICQQDQRNLALLIWVVVKSQPSVIALFVTLAFGSRCTQI